METTTLDKLPLGQEAIIKKVGGEGSILRRRLLDMGLTPRTRVMVRKRAPLGDPLEISLRLRTITRVRGVSPISSRRRRRMLPSPPTFLMIAS